MNQEDWGVTVKEDEDMEGPSEEMPVDAGSGEDVGITDDMQPAEKAENEGDPDAADK
jgi:hypothetical protein